MTRAADDFDAIGKRLAELRGEPAALAVCAQCEGCGWVPEHSPMAPAFKICPGCFNPEGRPSP